MTPAQRRKYRAALQALRVELAERGARRLEPSRTDDVEPPDAEDDQPLNEMLQTIASGRNRHDAQVLAALGRTVATSFSPGGSRPCPGPSCASTVRASVTGPAAPGAAS
jgi:hypothetical protein